MQVELALKFHHKVRGGTLLAMFTGACRRTLPGCLGLFASTSVWKEKGSGKGGRTRAAQDSCFYSTGPVVLGKFEFNLAAVLALARCKVKRILLI
jgi:hypothetical protein